MPSPVQTDLVSKGLVNILGIKGRYGQFLDESVITTIQATDFDDSPFQIAKPAGASAVSAAVAAQNAYVSVSPTVDVILQVVSVTLASGALGTVVLQRLTAANLVTLGAPLAVFNLRDFNAVEPPPATGPRLASVLETRTHIGVLGDEVARFVMQGNVPFTFTFPNGYFLIGNDQAGINALAAAHVNVNIALTASFTCRIWRLPG